MSKPIEDADVKSEPNVVPMIDVMLVLLIIFMIVMGGCFQGVRVTGCATIGIGPVDGAENVPSCGPVPARAVEGHR